MKKLLIILAIALFLVIPSVPAYAEKKVEFLVPWPVQQKNEIEQHFQRLCRKISVWNFQIYGPPAINAYPLMGYSLGEAAKAGRLRGRVTVIIRMPDRAFTIMRDKVAAGELDIEVPQWEGDPINFNLDWVYVRHWSTDEG